MNRDSRLFYGFMEVNIEILFKRTWPGTDFAVEKTGNMYAIVFMMAVVGAMGETGETCRSPLLPDLAPLLREKTWLFALEGSWQPYSYLDQVSGQARGFLYDLIYEACLRCDMKCKTVFIGDNLQTCLNNINLTAEGLFNDYFDGCVGWAPTAFRKNILAFSAPILKSPMARLYTRETTKLTTPEEVVAGKIVGFRSYVHLDELCLRANLLPNLRDQDIRHLAFTMGWEELIRQLEVKEIDLAVLPDGYPGTDDFVAIGGPFSCADGPYSIMHKKSKDLSWFGKCVQDLNEVGRYRTLCTNYDIKTCLTTNDLMTSRVAP
ncbi:unnamed protein product [Owenia fusiformis]|uniref:Uncharacterized protein n=1 Tax=Owenia fusiformis TaxID=6347 RepID=A0A8J1TSR0_OWEFU|nr:unnamed protein product [Owenia fusiformis]